MIKTQKATLYFIGKLCQKEGYSPEEVVTWKEIFGIRYTPEQNNALQKSNEKFKKETETK